MPVFRKENLSILYIHIPKTGGTSIELFFEENGFKADFIDRGGESSLLSVLRCSPQHFHAEILERIFNLRAFNLVFMTVRNPISRMRSEYRMRSHGVADFTPLNDWVLATLRRYPCNPYVLDNHIRPQHEFWVQGCRVYRQEEDFMETLVRDIAEATSVKFPKTQMGRSMHFASPRPETDIIQGEALEAVLQFYQQDFAKFGYERATGEPW